MRGSFWTSPPCTCVVGLSVELKRKKRVANTEARGRFLYVLTSWRGGFSGSSTNSSFHLTQSSRADPTSVGKNCHVVMRIGLIVYVLRLVLPLHGDKRRGRAMTTRRWAWKQPSFEESVIAQWSDLGFLIM